MGLEENTGRYEIGWRNGEQLPSIDRSLESAGNHFEESGDHELAVDGSIYRFPLDPPIFTVAANSEVLCEFKVAGPIIPTDRVRRIKSTQVTAGSIRAGLGKTWRKRARRTIRPAQANHRQTEPHHMLAATCINGRHKPASRRHE